VGAFFIPKLWVKLRIKEKVQSPLEFLSKRYNLPTQQIMAWSGVILKLFDMAAKWVAIAIIMNVFTGLPLIIGIFLSGGISMIYITVGGYLAVVLTDFVQFIIQVIAGISMFVIVMMKLGGVSSIFGIWDQLPEGNSQLFNSPYTFWFALVFLLINFFSYNGGTWNLATRFISARDPGEAKKTSILSGILYLVWPLILFFPMWASPLLFPDLNDPEKVYGLLAMELLPHGLIGLVLASMFANTMSMTSSDASTIAAVINRDILPTLSKRFINRENQKSLVRARITTFTFITGTVVLALFADHFGGVLGLLINWFAAFVGVISVPMILGLMPVFRRCGSLGAIISMIAGTLTFIITKLIITQDLIEIHPVLKATEIGLPVIVSLIVFLGFTMLTHRKTISHDIH
jgi:Na+/proline symporter